MLMMLWSYSSCPCKLQRSGSTFAFYAGLPFGKEVTHLSRVIQEPEAPVCLIAGAKIDTKNRYFAEFC